jgi:hypothetical protein
MTVMTVQDAIEVLVMSICDDPRAWEALDVVIAAIEGDLQ